MRSAFAFTFVLCLLGVRASAAPTPEQLRQAREVYAVGATAYAAQLYPDAEQAFRDVYALIHSPNVLYNLALTLEKQHKWGPAAEAYEGFLRDTRGGRDRHAIEKRAEEMRARAQRQEESALPKVEAETPAPSVAGNAVMKMEEPDDGLRGMDTSAPPNSPAVGEGEKKPLYKKWWLWVAIGGALVVAAVITAIVVVGNGSGGAPAAATTFPDFGPGAHGPLLRF